MQIRPETPVIEGLLQGLRFTWTRRDRLEEQEEEPKARNK